MPTGPGASLRIAAVALGALVVLLALAGMDFVYRSAVTTAAVMAVAVLAVLLVRRLLPARWRPAGVAPVLLAALAAYTAIRMGQVSGVNELLDHEVLERLGGEVDDAPTWLSAALGGGAIFLLVAALGRRPARGDRSRG